MFQILVREELPVFLLMTGLYENIRNLQDEKSLTFLYRAPRINLGPLNLTSIESKYKMVFNISNEEAKTMARLTNGYAFAFQALGFLTFKHNNDYKAALSDYRMYLEEYSYNKIWSKLSKGDKKILYGIVKSKTKNIKDILTSCNLDNNHFNPYRKRLIDKGILTNFERGTLRFVLPLFEEYILDNYFED